MRTVTKTINLRYAIAMCGNLGRSRSDYNQSRNAPCPGEFSDVYYTAENYSPEGHGIEETGLECSYGTGIGEFRYVSSYDCR